MVMSKVMMVKVRFTKKNSLNWKINGFYQHRQSGKNTAEPSTYWYFLITVPIFNVDLKEPLALTAIPGVLSFLKQEFFKKN